MEGVGENGRRLMGNTEIIVFGRFLLDSAPIKVNKSDGIGSKKLV